jgi:hypothetical protein
MPHERLKQSIADLLGGSLGLNVFPNSISSIWSAGYLSRLGTNPYLAGIRMGAFYVLLFCGIPWLLFFVASPYFPKPSWSLFFLQIYGGFWSGWATTSTKITSSSISKIIENNIIPELSAETAKKIDQEITRRFKMTRQLCVSWGIAILGAVLAGCLIYHDAPTISKPSIGEIVWWSLGWALLFATAANVVNVSRFYRLFAAHLEDDPGKLYATDPARSTLVISVATVAQRMLLFWFGIAVSIALVFPFGVKNGNSFGVEDWSSWRLLINYFKLDLSQNWFVFIEVLITGFFSIGFGTIVFLRSEAAIVRAVNRVRRSTLRLIEIEVADLSNRLSELDEANWNRFLELNSLHKDVAMAGSYRSVIVSGMSVGVPFVIPVISLFVRK